MAEDSSARSRTQPIDPIRRDIGLLRKGKSFLLGACSIMIVRGMIAEITEGGHWLKLIPSILLLLTIALHMTEQQRAEPPDATDSLSNTDAEAAPRLIALLLAMGELLYGVFLLCRLGWEDLIQFPVAVGFVVTVSYFVRAFTCPPVAVCRAIWALSLIVHGAWLIWVGIPDLPRAGPNLVNLWSAVATAASAVALATEPGKAEPRNAADSR